MNVVSERRFQLVLAGGRRRVGDHQHIATETAETTFRIGNCACCH